MFSKVIARYGLERLISPFCFRGGCSCTSSWSFPGSMCTPLKLCTAGALTCSTFAKNLYWLRATETSAADGQILMKEGDYSIELIAVEEGTADVIQGGKKIT